MRYLSRQQNFWLQHQATGPERLSMLAAFLDDLPPDRLTLGYWFRNGRGCAVGLAATGSPWFQAQGLRLRDMDDPARCHPVYRENSDWKAVAAFFDLSIEHCHHLLSANAYDRLKPSPQSIVRRIRDHLAVQTMAEVQGEDIAVGSNE